MKLFVITFAVISIGTSLVAFGETAAQYRYDLNHFRPSEVNPWNYLTIYVGQLTYLDPIHCPQYLKIAVNPRRTGTHIYREKVRRLQATVLDILNDIDISDTKKRELSAAVTKVARDAINANVTKY